MRVKLKDDQKLLGALEVETSDGTRVEIAIYTQRGGGIYIGRFIFGIDGGLESGETCFYCEGKLLGCIDCGTGGSPNGNCVAKTITCD